MKKIILAVASVLALGLVVGCKQQLEGSLNVTSTNYNKNLDASTTKNYVYSISGNVTTTTTETVYEKPGDYNSLVTTTTNVFTPTNDVAVTETTDPNNNSITYKFSVKGDVVQTIEYTYKGSSTAEPVKYKKVYDKTRFPVLGGQETNYNITKIDNKFYIDNADGTKKVVEGVDFSAATIDLSKFNDTTSTTAVSYLGATYDTITNDESATPTNYTTKTTTVTSGNTYALTLTRK